MIIIPAVDIKDGKCVQLVQGKPGTEQVVIDDPVEVALKWEKMGAKRLHIVDLDGALESGANVEIIKEIVEKTTVPVQMGGGIRSIEYAQKLLDMGVDTVIIGTMAVENPDILDSLTDKYTPDQICISLDSKDNRVLTHGWQKSTDKTPLEYTQIFQQKGAGSILFTNVDVEGLLGGIDLSIAEELIEKSEIPIIYSGGITSVDDLKVLRDINTDYVVIGSALYKGLIDFKEALKYQD